MTDSWELRILDRYLDPPDDPEDYDEYEMRWGDLSDSLYEERAEEKELRKYSNY